MTIGARLYAREVTLPLKTWSAIAPNLEEHRDNPIHTDAGAREAGYPAALVAGTTVYALLIHPPAAAWGLDWIAGGGSEVRFVDAVLADDQVECVVSGEGDRWVVDARSRGAVRATCTVRRAAAPPEVRDGEELPPLTVVLDDHWAGYGARSGDDLTIYDEGSIVHPSVWPCLANRMMKLHLVSGPWIHTRSSIVHLGAASRGSSATVRAAVVDRFETRTGKRAVVDMRISADGVDVCAIEHEAIVELS